MNDTELKELAVIGVRAEIARLRVVLEQLVGKDTVAAIAAPARVDRPARRQLTATQRKAISKRMKAMWKAKRDAKKKA